jgi:GH15 family glucan-1,4-alpha-glucosidase
MGQRCPDDVGAPTEVVADARHVSRGRPLPRPRDDTGDGLVTPVQRAALPRGHTLAFRPRMHGPTTSAIGDHAAIGDGRSVALVDRDGTIDWLCWPRPDSPSIFAALLDPAAGGHFRVSAGGSSSRRYVPGTNVLETRFEAAEGVLVLTDLVPIHTREDRRGELVPEHELLRVARCERGVVEVEVEVVPRPEYGRSATRLRQVAPGDACADIAAGRLWLRCSGALAVTGGRARGRTTLRAGERLALSLTLAHDAPAVLVPLGDWVERVEARTITWWRSWSARALYQGPFREAVLRSALALRLLVYPPSGAIVAAPTTSLPERLGGDLNWDYRYCWLRDAALTARALLGLGHEREAQAFVAWLLHATRLTRPALRTLYDVFGERPPRERTLPHLRGHRGSPPVRVGNAAREQLQLDVYGEVIDAVSQLCGHGATLDRTTGRMLRAWGRYVCRHWRAPDQGIWEVRGPPRHHVHSRVLCWVALDRLLRLADHGHLALSGGLRRRFETARAAIRVEVEERGWDAREATYVQTLGGAAVDASLLLLSWYGFHAPDDPRLASTYARVRRDLGEGDALLARNVPAPGWEEGAFGICGFWAVEAAARGGGTLAEATSLFERLLATANEVGLFAEETDPRDGSALGNFPQAFTHVGLISAALALEERARRERPVQVGGARALG